MQAPMFPDMHPDPKPDHQYALTLAGGQVVTGMGTSGDAAARRYLDTHPEATVTAYRLLRRQLAIEIPALCQECNQPDDNHTGDCLAIN